MEHEIKKLLEGLEIDKEIFNEKVMKKFALIMEAKLGEAKKTLSEDLQLEYEARYEVDKENMVDRLDEYLNYFVENFIEENRETVVDSVKVRTAEKILEKMDGFVNDFNLSLSEDNISHEGEVEDLRSELNESINENIELKTMLEEAAKDRLIEDEAIEIEIDSERETFVKLAENLEFEDADSFKENLKLLAENINISDYDASDEETLEEAEVSENTEKSLTESNEGGDESKMKSYLRFVER